MGVAVVVVVVAGRWEASRVILRLGALRRSSFFLGGGGGVEK